MALACRSKLALISRSAISRPVLSGKTVTIDTCPAIFLAFFRASEPSIAQS